MWSLDAGIFIHACIKIHYTDYYTYIRGLTMAGNKTNKMNFFSYDTNNVVSTADAGKQALSDWNRQNIAGEQCVYFINDVMLSELRANLLKEGKCQQLEFRDVEELQQFFKDYLFKDLSEEQANLAAIHASLQWHQSGIQHATYQHTWAYALKNFPNIQISAPTSHVHFMNTAEGALIIENNAYREWSKVQANGNLEKFTRTEKESHFAQTSTTYLFTPDSIRLQGLSIDCSEPGLAQLFDKQPEETTIAYLTNRFFIALYMFIVGLFSDYAYAYGEIHLHRH